MERDDLVLSRLVAMLEHVRSNPGISVDELAAHFGRSRAQAIEDIDRLIEAGEGDGLLERRFWIDSAVLEEQDRIELFLDPAQFPFPQMTSEDIALLLAGIEAMEPGLSEVEKELLPGLIAKLGRLVDSQLPRPETLQTGPTLHSLRLMREAVQQGACVDISYVGPKETTERTIEPHRVYQVEDGWVVDAWCRKANAPRTFRLDRMASIALGEKTQAPERPLERRRSRTFRLKLKRSAEWRLADLPVKRVRFDDGAIEVTMDQLDPTWIRGRLLWMGADVISTDPGQLLDDARTTAESALLTWKESQL